MRTEVKEYRDLVASEDFDEARKRLPQVYKVIDRTSQKGVIHSNTAARYKSRLAHLLKKSAAAE